MSDSKTTSVSGDNLRKGAGELATVFECENCGHKPKPQEVVDHDGDCAQCGDTVIAYTMDTALALIATTRAPQQAAGELLRLARDALATFDDCIVVASVTDTIKILDALEALDATAGEGRG